MSENEVGMAAPWIIFYHEIEALFSKDREVRVEYDADNYTIRLYVERESKALALNKILPMSKTFGNIEVKIEVIPANLGEEKLSAVFDDAFHGNPVFSYATNSQKGVYDFDYVVFAPKIAQFYTDDLSDINGFASMLYADIAKDVFDNIDGIHFCTDLIIQPI